VIVAIWHGLTREELRSEGFGESPIVDLSAAGPAMLIPVTVSGRPGQSGRQDDVKFNKLALEKIEHALRLVGLAPESFEWKPRNDRPSPYPGVPTVNPK
jgi:hypothetical protein